MTRVCFSLALLALFCPPARAQNVEAETLFVEGEKHMAAGQYDAACEAFAASNRLEARAGTLINLGLCEEKRERFASAWIAFREALTRVKDPLKKQVATEQSTAVEARLSYLTIEVPETSKLDGLVVMRDGQPVDAALFGRTIPIDGGKHTVAARAPGHEPWTSDVMVAKERDRTTVSIPKLQPLPGPSVPATGTPPTITPLASTPPAETAEIPNRHRGLAITFGVVGLVGLGTGVVSGLAARGADRDATALCPDLEVACPMAERANDLLDRRDRLALVANIGYGVAGLGAIAAGVAWFVGRTPASSTVAFTPTREGATITVRISF